MHIRLSRAPLGAALTVAALTVACGSHTRPPGPEGQVAIDVNALSLPGIADACYTLSVVRGDGSEVWSESSICSDIYGDGAGSLSFVGPCDASVNPNTVRLVLDDLFDSAGAPIGDYTSNCTAATPCERTLVCNANEDHQVEFDVRVLRDANVGFVDVSVNFEEVRCSAKLDCQDDAGDPLELLHDPQSDAPLPSVIAAISCASPEAQAALYLDDLVFSCNAPGGPIDIVVDPSAGPGHHLHGIDGPPPGLITSASFPTRSVVGAGAGAQTVMTVAVATALDVTALAALGVTDCTATLRGTAADTPFVPVAGGHDAGSAYPFVAWSVPVLDSSGGALDYACTQHPLGLAAGTGVDVAYTGADDTVFRHAFGD